MHIRVSITKNIKTKTSVINVIGLFPYTFNSPFRYFGFVSVFWFRFGKSIGTPGDTLDRLMVKTVKPDRGKKKFSF